jgi:CHAD domain-containing protein
MDGAFAETTLGRFAREQLAVRLSRLEEQWLRCSQCSSASAIHDIRVSIRRFGEPLRVLKKIFPKQGRKPVLAELRQVMRLAGRTRDIDIVRECFLYADIPLSPEPSLFLLNERAVAEAGLRAAISVGLASGFAARWQQALVLTEESAALPNDDSYAFLPDNRGSIWRENTRLVVNARSVLPTLLAEYCARGDCLRTRRMGKKRLHALRLNGKRLRYVLELFRPVYGRRMDELLSTLKETQSQSGDITDATATLAWLRKHGLDKTPEGQQLKLFLDLRNEKLSGKFADHWNDHWGLPAFHERWVAYLRRYAGQMPPQRIAAARQVSREPISAVS